MKHLIYEQENGKPYEHDDPEKIHDYYSYQDQDGRSIDVGNRSELARYGDYVRFAVYRDPVERAISAWWDKARPSARPHPFFEQFGLTGLAIDDYLDVLEGLLARLQPLALDEHLRPQVQCYRADDVNVIVPLQRLDAFMNDHFGLVMPPPRNRARGEKPMVTPAQRERIRSLYRDDYALEPQVEAT